MNSRKKILGLCIFLFIITSAFVMAYPLEDYVGSGYSSPLDIFEGNTIFDMNQEINLTPESQIAILNLSLNQESGFIYKKGYYFDIGNLNWVEFGFSEEAIGGNSDWIKNSASLNLEINSTNTLQNGQNFIITYSCRFWNGELKCGCDSVDDKICNKWMLHLFNVSGIENPAHYDTEDPYVELLGPENNTKFITTKDLKINISASDNLGLDNCELTINDVDINNTIKSLKGTHNDTIWNLSNLSNGDYVWNVECCDLSENCVFSENNFTFEMAYCLPSIMNTSWSNWTDSENCSVKDFLSQSRNLTQYDSNNCELIDNQTFFEYQNINCDYCLPNLIQINESCDVGDNFISWYNDTDKCFEQTSLESDKVLENLTKLHSCDYCVPEPINTSWLDWTNQTSCFANDTLIQNRSMIEYDSRYDSCYTVTGLESDLWNNGEDKSYFEYREESCDYCIEDLQGPFNTSCSILDELIQYYIDNNFETCCLITGLNSDCSMGNESYFNETLSCDYCTSDWIEIKTDCQLDDTVIGYYADNNSCYELTGLTSDNQIPANETYDCDYCTPNLVNASWTDWFNLTECLITDVLEQSRNITQYDSNDCEEVENETFIEYKNFSCDYCTPDIINTSWTNWTNGTGCRINDTILESKTMTQYDNNSCNETENQTILEYREVSCDHCTPNIINTSWTEWTNITECSIYNNLTQSRNLTQHDLNNCNETENKIISEEKVVECKYPCLDSDNGLAYYVFGGIGGVNDSCLSSNGLFLTINEFYCGANESVKQKEFLCDYGCAIENDIAIGRCAGDGTELTCSDSDNGKDYYTKGVIGAGDFEREDFCEGEEKGGITVTGNAIKLLTGVTGKIISTITGQVITENIQSDNLFEWYCENNTFNVEKYKCEFGCEDGKCIQGCSDSDNGIDYNIQGVVFSTSEGSFEDSCTNKTLIEYSCSTDNKINRNTKTCPYECHNGVCKECVEEWDCAAWNPSTCEDGEKQTRTCTDENKCGTTNEKPKIEKICSVEKTCSENWQCKKWTNCINEKQTRTCTDENTCGTVNNKPKIAIICTEEDSENYASEPIQESVSEIESSIDRENVNVIVYSDTLSIIETDDNEVSTQLEIKEKLDKVYASTLKGDKEIMVSPDDAIEKIGNIDYIGSFSLEEEEGDLLYNIYAEKEARIFFMFPATVEIKAKINAETGKIIQLEKSWWRFLAF